ncbi:MAG: hypothetical protein KH010_29365, partial [Hungatella hathewayi]|nr:hypothetical protein [Hungatella hathewayi]
LLSKVTCKLLNRLGTEQYARWCGRGINHPPIRFVRVSFLSFLSGKQIISIQPAGSNLVMKRKDA